jgi:hypothetical protein
VQQLNNQPISVERLEAALAIVARAIVLDGAIYGPIYDRLEREIAARRADDDVVSRAQRFLAAYTAGGAGASVPGCDPSASDKGQFDSALVAELLRGAP